MRRHKTVIFLTLGFLVGISFLSYVLWEERRDPLLPLGLFYEIKN